jgi:hypothetical protein
MLVIPSSLTICRIVDTRGRVYLTITFGHQSYTSGTSKSVACILRLYTYTFRSCVVSPQLVTSDPLDCPLLAAFFSSLSCTSVEGGMNEEIIQT